MNSLYFVHAACTTFMVGLIWFVQVVHYPLMADVGPDQFRAYSERHQSLTTTVVIGPMILEAVTGVALLVFLPGLRTSPAYLMSLGLLAAIWASTIWLQVPIHQSFLAEFDADALERLVRSNWLLTVSWTMRLALLALAWHWLPTTSSSSS